jgi:hypothetical protein
MGITECLLTMVTEDFTIPQKEFHAMPLFCIPLPYFCNVTIMKQGNGDHQNRSTRAGNDSLS